MSRELQFFSSNSNATSTGERPVTTTDVHEMVVEPFEKVAATIGLMFERAPNGPNAESNKRATARANDCATYAEKTAEKTPHEEAPATNAGPR